jgi:hypothetical protein
MAATGPFATYFFVTLLPSTHCVTSLTKLQWHFHQEHQECVDLLTEQA